MQVQLGRRGLAASLTLFLLSGSSVIYAHQWSVQELRQYHCLRTGLPTSQMLQLRRRAWAQHDVTTPAAGSAGSVVGTSTAIAAAPMNDVPCEAYWHLRGRLVNVYTGAEMACVEGVETVRNVGFLTSGENFETVDSSESSASSSRSSKASKSINSSSRRENSSSSSSSSNSDSSSISSVSQTSMVKNRESSSEWWTPVLAAHLAKEEKEFCSKKGRKLQKLPEGEEIVAHSAFVTSKVYTFHDLAPAAARAATPPQSLRAWCILPFRSGFLPGAVNPPTGDKACTRRLVVHTLHRDGTLYVASLPPPPASSSSSSFHLFGLLFSSPPTRPHTVVEGVNPAATAAAGDRGGDRGTSGRDGRVQDVAEKLPRWLALLNNPFGELEEAREGGASSLLSSSSSSSASAPPLDTSFSSVFSGPGDRRDAVSPMVSSSSLSSTGDAIKLSFFVGSANKAKTLRQSLVQFGPAPSKQPACREEYTYTPGRDAPPPPPSLPPLARSSNAAPLIAPSSGNPFETAWAKVQYSAQQMWPPSWPGSVKSPPTVKYRRLGPCPAWSPASQGSSGGLCALELTGRRYRHPKELLRALGPGLQPRNQPQQLAGSTGSSGISSGQSVVVGSNRGHEDEGSWPMPPPVRTGDRTAL